LQLSFFLTLGLQLSAVWCDGEEWGKAVNVRTSRRTHPAIANAVRHPAGVPRALRFPLYVTGRLACPRRPCCRSPAAARPPIRAHRGMHLLYNFSGCSLQTTDTLQWRRCLCAALHVEGELLSECVYFFTTRAICVYKMSDTYVRIVVKYK
jgi:hypothetical protein